MSETIVIGILSLVGTMFGSLLGILAANKLLSYRVEQLENDIKEIAAVDERVHIVETHEAVIDEEIKVINRRITDLESYHK